MAQTEPTLDQVVQEAQAGRVEHALQLMQPVLRDDPKSANAHYIDAELLARQGQASKARDELSLADRLAPGLPFARPDAVQSLRRELTPAAALMRSGFAPAPATAPPPPPPPAPALTTASATATAGVTPQSPRGASPWGVLWAICGGALLAWLVMRLGRPAALPAAPAAGCNSAYAGAGASPVPVPASKMGSQITSGLATVQTNGTSTSHPLGTETTDHR